MLKAIGRKIIDINRRRHIVRVRRAFAVCGYPVDHLEDSRIEAAVTEGKHRIADVPLTSQSIYFALRRLERDGLNYVGRAGLGDQSKAKNSGGISHGF